MITFLKKKEGFIGLVLKHIDASAMMDLLLRLISCVEPAPLRQEVLHVRHLNMYFMGKHQPLKACKVSNGPLCFFPEVAKRGEVGTKTHRAHPYWQR